MTALLDAKGLACGYGDLPVLEDIDISVDEGEVVAVLGPNGAGKTTLLRALAGELRPTAGTVTFDGHELAGKPANKVVAAGLALVPEGRKLFPLLTVAENLQLGAYTPRARAVRDQTLAEMYELFPMLAERTDQVAGSLSGGEQQMCAIARGLMSKPRVLMLDEPSLGLAPVVVDRVFELIRTLVDGGLTVLLVEQNVAEALALCTRGQVLENGRTALTGTGEELLADGGLRDAYLGGVTE